MGLPSPVGGDTVGRAWRLHGLPLPGLRTTPARTPAPPAGVRRSVASLHMTRPVLDEGELHATVLGSGRTITLPWQLLGPVEPDDGSRECKLDIDIGEVPTAASEIRLDADALLGVLAKSSRA